MTEAENELEDLKQLCRFQADELEIKDNQLRQIVSDLELRIQMTSDDRLQSENYFERKRLYFQLVGLNLFKRELDKIMEARR